MLRFIYRLNVNESVETDFNTSHVTVYPNRTSATYKHMRDFNTSHVTVYQRGS